MAHRFLCTAGQCFMLLCLYPMSSKKWTCRQQRCISKQHMTRMTHGLPWQTLSGRNLERRPEHAVHAELQYSEAWWTYFPVGATPRNLAAVQEHGNAQRMHRRIPPPLQKEAPRPAPKSTQPVM